MTIKTAPDGSRLREYDMTPRAIPALIEAGKKATGGTWSVHDEIHDVGRGFKLTYIVLRRDGENVLRHSGGPGVREDFEAVAASLNALPEIEELVRLLRDYDIQHKPGCAKSADPLCVCICGVDRIRELVVSS